MLKSPPGKRRHSRPHTLALEDLMKENHELQTTVGYTASFRIA